MNPQWLRNVRANLAKPVKKRSVGDSAYYVVCIMRNTLLDLIDKGAE